MFDMVEADNFSVVLIQFAKWPEEGRVKTRLMPLLGATGACNAHIALTVSVLDNLCKSGYPVQFWWDRQLKTVPKEAGAILRRLEREKIEGSGVEQKYQTGQTLGHRILAALDQSLASYGCALIVGSDCPSVDAGYIHQAVKVLAGCDVVLGPSDDGGYVLIGANRVVPGMLDGIQWGTRMALEQTKSRLEELGLRVTLLEPRWDVDEPEDWLRFKRLSQH
jgi:rSAM/selenodomain-associated transferase 1